MTVSSPSWILGRDWGVDPYAYQLLNRDQVQGTHPLIKPGSPKLVHAFLRYVEAFLMVGGNGKTLGHGRTSEW